MTDDPSVPPSSDPLLAAFQPIGDAMRAPVATRGGEEQRQRRRKHAKAQGIQGHPFVRVRQDAADLAAQMKAAQVEYAFPPEVRILPVETQKAIASAIVAKYGEQVLQDGGRPSDQKAAATVWAIAQDKLSLLEGRPTQILGVTDAEEHREAIWALVARLKEAR